MRVAMSAFVMGLAMLGGPQMASAQAGFGASAPVGGDFGPSSMFYGSWGYGSTGEFGRPGGFGYGFDGYGYGYGHRGTHHGFPGHGYTYLDPTFAQHWYDMYGLGDIYGGYGGRYRYGPDRGVAWGVNDLRKRTIEAYERAELKLTSGDRENACKWMKRAIRFDKQYVERRAWANPELALSVDPKVYTDIEAQYCAPIPAQPLVPQVMPVAQPIQAQPVQSEQPAQPAQ